MKLIVGLGNPGEKYQQTYHNLGFLVLDNFAQEQKTTITTKKHEALIGEANIADQKIILMKPQTFMNLSGQAIAKAKKFYKIALEDILVIHDDLDLEPGVVRYRRQGSSAGHNGLKSIIESLGTKEFSRIKIGIGKPSRKTQIEKYVLSKIKNQEIYDSIAIATDKLKEWLNQ